MSGIGDKTPSESYKDLLSVGEDFGGLSKKMSNITDGSGNNTKIRCSLNSIDIDFGGGSLSSFLSNSISRSFKINNIEYSGTYEVKIGNPGIEFFIPMFFSSPDPGPVSPCEGSSGDIDCRVISIVIKKPECLDSLSEYPSYSKTELFLTTDLNSVRYNFSSYDGYEIVGIDHFHPTSRGFDLIKIEFINNTIDSTAKIHISLLQEDYFNRPAFNPPPGSFKYLCEDSWNIYEEYERKGKKSKPGIPLRKSTPAGSYADLVFIDSENSGLGISPVAIKDGNGSEIGIEVSLDSTSVFTNGGTLTDPIFSSYNESLHAIEIIDSQNIYEISSLSSDHIFIHRTSSSAEELNANVIISIDDFPIKDSLNPNESTMSELRISYKSVSAGFEKTNIAIKFKKQNEEFDGCTFEIPAINNTVLEFKRIIIIHNYKIEEVIEL